MADKQKPVTQSSAVNKFLDQVRQTPAVKSGGAVGRLLFAMDATASREPTWDRACHLQGQMFEATADIGNLSVQLCYYRGFNDFNAGDWCMDAASLQNQMSAVRCLGGYSQISRVLEHAMKETKVNRMRAVVFVGDAIEEDADKLCHLAGQLGVLNLPLFMFQEGDDPFVTKVFQQMAMLSGGAYAPFDLSSATQLKDLLSAVAIYAAGGREALQRFEKQTGPAALLTRQLKK
jgi:hypothetical protein